MASFAEPFLAKTLRRDGRKFAMSLCAACIVLSVGKVRTCMGAKLGARSIEYNGAIQYYTSNYNKLGYNYPYTSPYNYPLGYPSTSEENQAVPKPEALQQTQVPIRENSRYAENGVEHGKTFMITLYQWNNHLGRPARLEWSDTEADVRACKSIPSKSRGKVRSINTHNNCVVLYSREGCRGSYRTIKRGSPSHNRLSDLCFHKKPISVRPCTEDEVIGRPHRNDV